MKRYRNVFAFTLALCVMITGGNVFATSAERLESAQFEAEKIESIKSNERVLFESKVLATAGDSIEMVGIKTVFDFAGNEFTVVECMPTGYYIYHNATGIFSEYSVSAVSPYAGLNGDIYYGGPAFYYVKDGDTYIHTVLGSEVPVSATPELADSCEGRIEWMESKKNEALVSAINNTAQRSDALVKESIKAMSSAAGIREYITNAVFFQNMTGSSVGYYLPEGSAGICGYIASNMVLRYWNSRGAISLPSRYTTVDAINTALLTQDLLSIGHELDYGDSPMAPGFAAVINEFAVRNGIPEVAAFGLLEFDIVGELSRNRPSIAIGVLNTGTTHAVVVYGLERMSGEISYIANFGWPEAGWSEVIVFGLISSNVCYRA